MGRRDRDLLVKTQDELWVGIAAMIDYRIVQAAKARSWGHRQVTNPQFAEQVRDEVRNKLSGMAPIPNVGRPLSTDHTESPRLTNH
jgi:hypothetical protein